MEMFIATHEDYVYDELFDELKEIRRLKNESVDNFFLRVMQICHRFPENDKPSDQLISNWFSYLVSDPERCDLDDQTISNSQNSGLTTKDKGYTISNKHSIAAMGESLSEILDPLASECEPFNDPPSENHEHIWSVMNPSLKKSHHFQNLKIFIPFIQICLMESPHEHPSIYHAHYTLHISF
jgi:hypothetical protein